jgi:aryl-alcohol dehydrogenase-like predicted oxidoreductase
MQYRKLGNSSLEISAIGLGCMTMIGIYGKADDAESEATIHHAIDRGVNFLDTSDAYGNGKNEELVGRAVKGRRDKVVLCTKFGNLRNSPSGKTVDGRPEYAAEACELSLKRLGVDVIDLYLLHRVDPDVPIEETVGGMKTLIDAGKVRYIGLSEAGTETMRRGHSVHPLSAVESEYSLMYRDAEKEWLPTCDELGMTYIGYSPLGRSLLTGAIKTLDDLPEGDRRRAHPRFQEANLSKNVAMVRALQEVGDKHDCSPSRVALAWVLAQRHNIVPIPGAKQRKHLDDNIAAADLTLEDDDLKRLGDIFKPGATAGTRYPEKQMGTVGI